MDVIRNFGIDYIFFDLIFLAIFLFLLIKYRKTIPLMVFFVGSLIINLLIDWGIWLHTGIREVALPFNFTGSIFLFFLWFSISYGVEYAYVFIMFEKKSNKLAWTLFVFLGWLLVAFLSQFFSINDAPIMTLRHMTNLKFLMVAIVILGYGLLFLLKYKPKKIAYLFFVGFIIHFMMEFTLLVSGIRPSSIFILIENSLIEFNMGIPFFYIFYDKYLRKKFS